MFHSEGQLEDEGLNDSDVYVDVGDDPTEKAYKEFCKQVKKAAVNSISEQGTRRLERII